MGYLVGFCTPLIDLLAAVQFELEAEAYLLVLAGIVLGIQSVLAVQFTRTTAVGVRMKILFAAASVAIAAGFASLSLGTVVLGIVAAALLASAALSYRRALN